MQSPFWSCPLGWLPYAPPPPPRSLFLDVPPDLGMDLRIGKTNMAFQSALTLSRLGAAKLVLAPAASAR